MPNLINRLIVRQLSGEFTDAEGMVIVSLSGLSVQETDALRSGLAEQGIRLRMVRNRLARIALAESGFEPPDDLLAGNMAFVCGDTEEAIHAAKVLQGSDARKDGRVVLRGGLLDGNFLGQTEAKALAALPGRDELHGMMLSAIIGPARMLVGLINAPPSALVRVIQARIDAGGFTA